MEMLLCLFKPAIFFLLKIKKLFDTWGLNIFLKCNLILSFLLQCCIKGAKICLDMQGRHKGKAHALGLEPN